MIFKFPSRQAQQQSAQPKPALEVICPRLAQSDFLQMRCLVGQALGAASREAGLTGSAPPLAILFSEDALGTRFDVETGEAEREAEFLSRTIQKSGIWAAVAFSGRQVLEEFTDLCSTGYLATADGWKVSQKRIYSDHESMKFDSVFGGHIVKNWMARSADLVAREVPFATAQAPNKVEIEYVVGEDVQMALVEDAPRKATLVSAMRLPPGATDGAWRSRRLLVVNESSCDAPTTVSGMRSLRSREMFGRQEVWRISFFEQEATPQP